MYQFKNNEELQQFLKENLLDKHEAIELTNQSIEGFNQAVKRGVIKPFYQTKVNQRVINKLYLKSDILEYASKKKQ